MSWSGKYKNGESFNDLTDDEVNAFESEIDVETVSENAQAPAPAPKAAAPAPVKALAPSNEIASQSQVDGIRAMSGSMFPYGTEIEGLSNPTTGQRAVAAFKDIGSLPGRLALGATYGTMDAFGGQNFAQGMKDGMAIENTPDAGTARSLGESVIKDPYGGAAMIAAPIATGVAGVRALGPAVSKLGPVVKKMQAFASSRPVVTALGANAAGGAALGGGTQASENIYNDDAIMQDVGSSAGIGALVGGLGTGVALGAKAGFSKLRESGVGRMAGRILENVQEDMKEKVAGLANSTISDATKGKVLGLKKAISEAFAGDAATVKGKLDDIYTDLDEKLAEVTNPNVVVDNEAGRFNPNTRQFERHFQNDELEKIHTRAVSPYSESVFAESQYTQDANKKGILNNLDVPSKVKQEALMPRLARDAEMPGYEQDRTIYPGGKKPDHKDLGSGYISPSQTRELMNDLRQYAQDYNGPNKADVMSYVNVLNDKMATRLDDIYVGTRPIRAEDLPMIKEGIKYGVNPALLAATDEQLLAMTPKQINEQILKGLPEGSERREIFKGIIERGESGAGLAPNLRVAMDAAASSKALAEGIGRTKYPGIKAADAPDIGTLKAATYTSAPIASLGAKVMQWADTPLNRIRAGNAGAGTIQAMQNAAPKIAPYIASTAAQKPKNPESDKNGQPKGAQEPDTISSLRHLADLASTGRNMTEMETDRVYSLIDLANAGALSAKDTADIKTLYGRYRQ